MATTCPLAYMYMYLGTNVRCRSSCRIRLLSRALSRLLGLLQLLDEVALFLSAVLQHAAPTTQLLQLSAMVGNTLLELRKHFNGKQGEGNSDGSERKRA